MVDMEELNLKRSLHLGRSLYSQSNDYDTEINQLASEFEGLIQGHVERIAEIEHNEEMTSDEKITELKYEKAMMMEEQQNYNQAFQEINEAKAENYEGFLSSDGSEYSAEEYCGTLASASELAPETATSQNQDSENSY